MDGLGEQRQLEGFRCPTCSGPYDLIRVLGRYGRSYKLLVRCPSCKIYGIGTAQMITPPKGREPALAGAKEPPACPVAAAPPGDPVSVADVLAMREFLRTFNGDFHSLWPSEADG